MISHLEVPITNNWKNMSECFDGPGGAELSSQITFYVFDIFTLLFSRDELVRKKITQMHNYRPMVNGFLGLMVDTSKYPRTPSSRN